MNREQIIKLYKFILNREPTKEEIDEQIKSKIEEKDLIKKLGTSVEKIQQLFLLSGERIKTQVQYSDEEIENFFSTNKFKVAICLSGHVRDYEENLSSINRFLVNPLKADVFIHTWDSFGDQIKITRETVGPVPDEDKKISIQFEKYLNNIKKIEIGNNQNFLKNFHENGQFYLYGMRINEQGFYGGQAEPKFICSQLFSIYRSFQLLEEYVEETGNKYDLVIKMRADYELFSGITEKEINKIKTDDCFYVPTIPYSNHGHPICCLCENQIEHEEHIEDVCDVFCYSSYENMKFYMEIFKDIDEIKNALNEENNKILSDRKLHNHKGYYLVDIWRENDYNLNCFYPERLFRKRLQGRRLMASKLSGKVRRKN